jgi:hypothetical protein
MGTDQPDFREFFSRTKRPEPAFLEKNSRNSGRLHDDRTHRNQRKKSPFSPAELKEKRLMKV